MKVVVAHTLAPSLAPGGRVPDEFDLSEACEAVMSVVPGAVAQGIEGRDDEFAAVVRDHRPEVVFNLCEAPLGRPDREAHAASRWQSLGVRFTGARGATLELCRVKDRVNTLLSACGIAIPGRGSFPCLVKPAEEDGSAWIRRESVCRDQRELKLALASVPARALVEEFIPGREFAVSVWGGDQPEYFSVGETVFANGLELITYDAKWMPESADYMDSPVSYATEVSAGLRGTLEGTAGSVWKAVGAHGYLRVDVRLNDAGVPHVLDVNPNPALGRSGGIRAAAEAVGWSWERFVTAQIDWAC
jgi:D-alanine-D-alanine ligase